MKKCSVKGSVTNYLQYLTGKTWYQKMIIMYYLNLLKE